MPFKCLCGLVADDRQLFLRHLELDSYEHAEDFPGIEYADFEEWVSKYQEDPDPVVNMQAAWDAGYVLGWDDAETYFK